MSAGARQMCKRTWQRLWELLLITMVFSSGDVKDRRRVVLNRTTACPAYADGEPETGFPDDGCRKADASIVSRYCLG